ncbi:MAG TPA: COX15/CtaA family protein [Verrucomicrobiae bacterium]|nr:COX15/CtaA family protein [Verrucomicrobiae bacterium]
MTRYPNRQLHRFACLLAWATFILIVAGASVTSNRAGLAVPDWPTTYGQFMFSFPTSKWVGNILYEHGHRLIASVVGMLTIILAIWLVRAEPRRWVRRLGITALAVVIAQGVLGGLTVKFMLPPSISIAHASLAEGFFCITVILAFVTSERWMEQSPVAEIPNASFVQRVALATTAAVYGQIILGATIRHAESGLYAHIFGAVAVFGCIVTGVVMVLFTVKQKGFLRHATLLLCLVAAQIALGLVTLMVRVPKNASGQLSAIQVFVPTLHLALGALILATSLGMALKAYRFLGVPREDPALPFAEGVLS